MKIEISEQPSNEPLFPAFYKDKCGDLWFWLDEDNGVCINGPSIHYYTGQHVSEFENVDTEYGLIRVHGTITITV